MVESKISEKRVEDLNKKASQFGRSAKRGSKLIWPKQETKETNTWNTRSTRFW